MELLIYFIPLCILWFAIYWIVGGVIFAISALFRVVKIRKAQFSCLFTFASLFCAFGATYTAATMGMEQINVCLESAVDIYERFASVIACGIFAIMLSGAIWFIGLLIIGSLLLYISRAKNQSWVDEKLDENNPHFVVSNTVKDPLIK